MNCLCLGILKYDDSLCIFAAGWNALMVCIGHIMVSLKGPGLPGIRQLLMTLYGTGDW